MELTFSQACENNKAAILTVLQNFFKTTKHVLEVGSGTGQHAIHFAEKLPHLSWQTSDLLINHFSINQRISSSQLNNILTPIHLDLNNEWPMVSSSKTSLFDGIFTANTLHIISWDLVQRFFTGVQKNLKEGGTLCIYGPFNYEGTFTSESNANFELWLKDRDINSGIRDFEAIELLAKSAKLSLISDNAMPANNRLLVFIKTG
jgi:cyclopropane fatty-acyl-phospholipid synthase-like methyltransferase